MRTIVGWALTFIIALAVAVFGAPLAVRAQGGPYTDDATSQWFQSLMVPGTNFGCCSQADCHPTPAEFRGGAWWAKSEYGTDEWVVIPAYRVLSQPSIFTDGVLCESSNKNGDNEPIAAVHSDGSPAGRDVWVYCFAAPPQFF